MESANNTVQETEFVFRRLSEGLQLAGKELNPYLWLAVLVPVLALAVVYAGWMYARDARSVGWRWATLLAALRMSVYGILAFVFLLPAWETWEKTEDRSKVILLVDVSDSMGVRDDAPTESMPVEKLLTRQDKVIRFLADEKIGFVQKLQAKNPVTAYRFGGVLDEDFKALDPAARWSVDQWADWLKPNPRREIPGEASPDAKARLVKQRELESLLANGTNLPESLLGALNRESGRMVQGIVVFSDGRSTQSSGQTLNELRQRAQKGKVPVFTVAVGDNRPPVSIQIAELQAPEQVRPDDKFSAHVEIDGVGMTGKEIDVALDVIRPTGEKITIKPILKPGEGVVFKPGEPPHAQAEFEIDKPELEGEWKLVARVPRDRRETFSGREHISEPATVAVVKKPLRVLLFAGGPTHDYQFARNLFVRETERHRAEVSIYLQSARGDVVQDVPPDRMLRHFPNALLPVDDARETAEDRYYNLSQYDLIWAFDPDWTQLTDEELNLLEKWVGSHAGGLILVAGPVNTFQLTRGANYEKMKPLLELFPVVLEDSRLKGYGVERPTTEPWRLYFHNTAPDMEFLRLDEDSKDPLGGWEEFFTGHARTDEAKETTLRHGFYDYYPVKDIKSNAQVIASFADPRAHLPDGREQPFLAVMLFGNGRVVYLSSGEIYRLRQYREAYYERFVTKLARYAGSGNMTRLNNFGVLVMAKSFTNHQLIHVEAQLFGRDLQPLAKTEKPRAKVSPADDPKKAIAVELLAKPSDAAGYNGWFTGRFLLPNPGTYEIQLPIPGTPEVLSRKFTVKASNPELDNTAPDFEQLRDLAGDASQVFARIPEALKGPIQAELERTNQLPAGKVNEEDKQGLKLYFDLKAAALVPDCMVTDRKTQKSRGAVKDIWDDGIAFGNSEPPLKLSLVLLVVVGLLSVEWLARKLLKLA